jgi:hypothetical protein
MSFISDSYGTMPMTLLDVSATPGSATTRIGSRGVASAGCTCGGVCLSSVSCHGTESCLCNAYHFHSALIIPGQSFGTTVTHSARVFPYNIDSGNSITTVSVSSVRIISVATEVKVIQRLISSVTSAPGISASQTNLLTMDHISQTWFATDLVPGTAVIQYFWP